jgi:hypothetical protein
MELIPLVRLKKRKILGIDGNIISLDELKTFVDKDDIIYFYDLDGIEKDRPNLCIYQRISHFQKMWIDSGPRNLGDVVDEVMAGATSITLRTKMWPELHVSSIKEIIECKIFMELNVASQEISSFNFSLFPDVDGFVIFITKDQIERDFKVGGFLKDLCLKHRIYVYESDLKNNSYWKTLGVSGLIVDIDKTKGV